MRIAITLTFALAAILFSASCKRDAKTGTTTDSQTTTAPAQGAAVATAVKHYICPNNCAGSGGDAAGTCPVCGSEYLHNDAFHNQPGQQPATPQQPTVTAPQSGQSPVIQMPPSNDPPQNAKGVWHYICSNGCAGGSGTAGTCPKCGGTLAHNDAYHQ